MGLQLCRVPLVGVFELAAVMCLALAACSVDPDRASAVLIAAAGGVALGGLLALVGVRDLNSALVGPRTPDTRLDGIYGNSKFLAYAVAFCVPVLVVLSLRKRGYVRVLLLISLSTAAVILALTFSRGGLLAACCGGVAAAILAATSRRRVALTATVAIALVAVALPCCTRCSPSSVPRPISDRCHPVHPSQRTDPAGIPEPKASSREEGRDSPTPARAFCRSAARRQDRARAFLSIRSTPAKSMC